jgi:4'-phosphopantetheinyl transferase
VNIDIENNTDWLHLWKFDSLQQKINTKSASVCLSHKEITRAQKFINESDRTRYIKAHYFLRQVLTKYLKINANQIEFVKGFNNKPYLKFQNSDSIYFNLSYRDNMFLLGISSCETMGVDIERIREVNDVSSFCNDYFAAQEKEIIMTSHNKDEQLAKLFTFWVIKESVIKALGTGFTKPLPTYDLHVFLETPISKPNFDLSAFWTIQQIKINDHYKAAFAIKSEKVAVENYRYEINI